MNYIPYKEGCTYEVKHLKPFSLDEALKGHPLATNAGRQVRLFRKQRNKFYVWDAWYDAGAWGSKAVPEMEDLLDDYLCLAPLAIRNGRALHVGDEIIFKSRFASHPPEYKTKAEIRHYRLFSRGDEMYSWKFADEVVA